MNNANLLLLSSSKAKNTPYLSHALPMIKDHLGEITELLFIPYAGVTVSYDNYIEMVRTALKPLKVNVVSIHQCDNAIDAVNSAQAIVVGGGNTFHLLHQLYEHDLVSAIQQRVAQGVPYIGWSAGSNIAGHSIRTTNDMPIIEPKSFNALNLVSFQLNPHYTDFNPPGHNGETRAQRLAEFCVINPKMPVVGIVEGCALKLINGDANSLTLLSSSLDSLQSNDEGYLFLGTEKTIINSETDLSFLLKPTS